MPAVQVLTDAPMSVERSYQVKEMRRKMGEIAFEQLGARWTHHTPRDTRVVVVCAVGAECPCVNAQG